MTIADLRTVYHGNVHLTILGYYKNGKYYSFRTYGEGSIKEIDEGTAQLEIISTFVGEKVLYIDVREIIERDEQDAAD